MLKPTLDAKQLAELLHLKPYTVTDYTIRHPESFYYTHLLRTNTVMVPISR